MFTFNNLNDAYQLIAQHVMLNGRMVASRSGDTREVCGVGLKILKPDTLPVARGMNMSYACGELLWYLSLTNKLEFISHYAPSYHNYANEVLTPNGRVIAPLGGYGERWKLQLYPLIELLRRDPNTRQACLTTWHLNELAYAQEVCSRDVPCTLSIQFLIRQGELHAIATMRSNDLWLGFAYDMFCFTQLQCLIAEDLGVSVGTYTHNVGSLHAYTRDVKKIDRVLSQPVIDAAAVRFCDAPPSRRPLDVTIPIALGLERSIRTSQPTMEQTGKLIHDAELAGTRLGTILWYAAERNWQ